MSSTMSGKYLMLVRDTGKTEWTRARVSLSVLTETRMSRKRTPFWSCSGTPTDWQRTEGRAVWHVGELCVPGIDSMGSGQASSSCFIQA